MIVSTHFLSSSQYSLLTNGVPILQAWQIAQEKTEAAAREVAQANIAAQSANKALLEAQKREAVVKQEAEQHDQVSDCL